MIDNIKLCSTSIIEGCNKAKNAPFEHKGMVFYPRYNGANISRFEADLRNLKVIAYPSSTYLINSLHKYRHGTNGNDFSRSEILETILQLNDITGIDWQKASVKKIEYGCNVKTDTEAAIDSLIAYKNHYYLPMANNNKVVGKKAEFEEYGIKGYSKTLQTKLSEKLTIPDNIFRWEIVAKNSKYLARLLSVELSLKNILEIENFQIMAKDAIKKYDDSEKDNMKIEGLTIKEKMIVATMANEKIAKSIKVENPTSYKKYISIYRQIMANRNMELTDKVRNEIAEKLHELLNN